MEELKGISSIPRNSKRAHFDKRVVSEVLEQVYAGVSRKKIMRFYNVSDSTITRWLRDFGSDDYRQNLPKTYSQIQKRSIVTAIEEGRISIPEAQISYGIRSAQTIRGWIAGFESEKAELCVSTPEIMSNKKTEKPSEDIVALRKQLEEAQMKIRALNIMIDIAEDQLKIDIRKKSGARQSGK